MAVSTQEYLSSLGVSMDQARQFILSNLATPGTIFNVAYENRVTSGMLAEVLSNDFYGLNSAIVESYFDGLGFDGSLLSGYSGSSSEPYEFPNSYIAGMNYLGSVVTGTVAGYVPLSSGNWSVNLYALDLLTGPQYVEIAIGIAEPVDPESSLYLGPSFLLIEDATTDDINTGIVDAVGYSYASQGENDVNRTESSLYYLDAAKKHEPNLKLVELSKTGLSDAMGLDGAGHPSHWLSRLLALTGTLMRLRHSKSALTA